VKLKHVSQQVVVLVGATSGIGRASAFEFARQGARLVISARDSDAVERLGEELRSTGAAVEAVAADVTDMEHMRGLVRRAIETFGRVDTWVHLASISVWGLFVDTLPEEFRQVVEINLLGAANGARAALEAMGTTGGALLLLSSVGGRTPLPYQSAYTASKFGIDGLASIIRLEARQQKMPVSVTTVLPSSINTPLFDKALTRIGVVPRPVPPIYDASVAARAIVYAAQHPLREMFVGGGGFGLNLLKRISSKLSDLVMLVYGFPVVRSDRPKSADAPSNLYRHLPGYDRVEGSFGHLSRGFSLLTWLEMHPMIALGMGMGGLLGLMGLMSMGGGKKRRRR